MTRVLVAAARPTARAGLAAVLHTGTGLEVVGEAASAGDLLALAASQIPEVALIELESATEELSSAIVALPTELPALALVVLCDADSAWIAAAVRNGVRGILTREAESAEIVAAVGAAAQGLLVLPAATARALLPVESAAIVPARGGGAILEPLTPRELEVLRLLGEGLGNKAIALRLRISEHTVKFHVGAVMAKLTAASRTEAVATAARRGLIML